jgi:hypothetical protein
MPNVTNMEERMRSHLARVTEKAIAKELGRIHALYAQGKISSVTKGHMTSTAAIRLAWKANAA